MRITKEIAIIIERVVFLAMLGLGTYIMLSPVYEHAGAAISNLAALLG